MKTFDRRRLTVSYPTCIFALLTLALGVLGCPITSAALIDEDPAAQAAIAYFKTLASGDIEKALTLCVRPSDPEDAAEAIAGYRAEMKGRAIELGNWGKAKAIEAKTAEGWTVLIMSYIDGSAGTLHAPVYLKQEGSAWKMRMGDFLDSPNDEWDEDLRAATRGTWGSMTDEQWKGYTGARKIDIERRGLEQWARFRALSLNGNKLRRRGFRFGIAEDTVKDEDIPAVMELWDEATKLSEKRVAAGEKMTPSQVYSRYKKAIKSGNIVEAISLRSRVQVVSPKSRVLITQGINRAAKIEDEREQVIENDDKGEIRLEATVENVAVLIIQYLGLDPSSAPDSGPATMYRVETLEKVNGEWQLEARSRSRPSSASRADDLAKIRLIALADLKIQDLKRTDRNALD